MLSISSLCLNSNYREIKTYTHISNILVNCTYEKYLYKQISISIHISYLYKIHISQDFVICSFLFTFTRNLIGTRFDSLLS